MNVGVALVPYFQHILPMLNILLNRKPRNHIGMASIDQHKKLVDTIDRTVEALEQYGGPDAFVNIKYAIPTYQSCFKNL